MARVRADRLLVERGLFESRAKAQAAIAAGRVTAGGRVVRAASEPLDPDVELNGEAAFPWVGRAALKLAHALSAWPIAVEDRVVLDVGASTGGFTEVCLQRRARRVYAVDVGRGQLHPRLVGDLRVVDLQATDARRLTPELIPEPPELVVCDASFIGLAKVLPVPLSLAATSADLVALVKPQFELGPGRVDHRGVVRDRTHVHVAVDAVSAWLETQEWSVQATADSPITGGDGNQEVLLWARRG